MTRAVRAVLAVLVVAGLATGCTTQPPATPSDEVAVTATTATTTETTGSAIDPTPVRPTRTETAAPSVGDFCAAAADAFAVVDELSSDPSADIAALSRRLDRLTAEMQASAPAEIAALLSSPDPEDAGPLADYLRDTCDLELPDS